MKLQNVDVHGFGRLRDVRIEFNPRVTVLLGPNEAGKSTVQRVIRAALYGLDAGSQGRAAEKSDWARWAPWSAGRYGFALTLEMSDGASYRIAARLDTREHKIQVVEVGGGDVTTQMRSGRIVTPGLHLLGIDESVFSATAWLGEEALRLGAPDAATQRAAALQEAVERLADSGEAATAAEAIVRLRAALDRIGTERKIQSPLGAVTARLRVLEPQIREAQRKQTLFSGESVRLQELELQAERATQEQADAERAWLVGRLAGLGARRLEMQRAMAEATELKVARQATAHAAEFTVAQEPQVLALVGESRQACSTEAEAVKRWDLATPELQIVQQRRQEISAGITALGDTPELSLTQQHERALLTAALENVLEEKARLGDTTADEARATALRGEIAATGLGGIRIGSADMVAELIATASTQRRSRKTTVFTAAFLSLAVISSLCLWLVHLSLLAAICGTAFVVAGAVVFTFSRLLQSDTQHARRQLQRLCPDLDISRYGLEKAAERIESLLALHQDLLAQQIRISSQRAQLDGVEAKLTELAQRAQRISEQLGVRLGHEPEDVADRIRSFLDVLASYIDISYRREQLAGEDAQLGQVESKLLLIHDEAERAYEARVVAENRLSGRLGLRDKSVDLESAVANFSTLCEQRRAYDMATARLAALRPSLGGPQSETQIVESTTKLSQELIARGGNPAAAAAAAPLSETALAGLEHRVETARQQALNARREADGLRIQLTATFEGLPNLADLEDEFVECSAARNRAMQQRKAINTAIDFLEQATRTVHRDLAPRLAETISENLSLVTEQRYSAVNVDTDHFAITLEGDRPELIPLEQVSHGTRDQVALLLRLALADVLSDRGEPVPLFLDEPLLSADPSRREHMLDFLCHLSERHQLVITANDPVLATAFVTRLEDQVSVVRLEEAPTAELEATPQRALRNAANS